MSGLLGIYGNTGSPLLLLVVCAAERFLIVIIIYLYTYNRVRIDRLEGESRSRAMTAGVKQ